MSPLRGKDNMDAKGPVSEDAAYEAAVSWFLCGGTDITEVRGVSLGKVFQIHVFETFYPQANALKEGKGLYNLVKRLGYDWHLRFFHSYLHSLRSGVACKKGGIVLLYDVNNSPSIANLNLVSGKLSESNIHLTGLTVNRNIQRRITHAKDTCLVGQFYSPKMEAEVRRLAGAVSAALESAREKIKENIERCCPSRTGFADEFISRIKRDIPQAIREILSLERAFEKLSPDTVVMASDAHRISRMAAIIAGKMGISTTVIQHGAPIWKYGYVPVYADRMAVWGEESREWFEKHGVPGGKLVVTGCPRYDNLGFAELENAPTRPALYLMTNPIDKELNRKILETFAGLPAKGFREVAVKVHPSEKDLSLYEETLKGTSIRVIRDTSIKELVRPCDIIVVGNSTAGIDALAAGCVLVNLELEGFPNSIPYEKYGVAITTGFNGLEEAVREAFKLREGPGLQDHQKKCRQFIRSYLCELDGRSTDRVASLVKAQLPG